VRTCDAIVIGAGQSGPSMAARFAKAGMRVAMVERDQFGGTCVNNGCTPTKAMVASARTAWLARRATEYGVDVGGNVSVDMKRVKARKDAIVGASRQSGRELDALAARRDGAARTCALRGCAHRSRR
jgi:pyruvate/2-oxoglutarate dehydrogenase complex dihydrolipoamide dehydrogenase (E3) component